MLKDIIGMLLSCWFGLSLLYILGKNSDRKRRITVEVSFEYGGIIDKYMKKKELDWAEIAAFVETAAKEKAHKELEK